MSADSGENNSDQHPAVPPQPQEDQPRTDSPATEAIRRIVREEFQFVQQEIRAEFHAEIHSGPLPHPETLAGYERVVTGSANRIIAAFERQGDHRRDLEKYALRWGNIRSFVGLGCGLVVVLTLAILSYLLIKGGHETSGTILGTADIAALAGVFVYGSQLLRDERIRKTKIMTGQDREERPGQPRAIEGDSA